MSVIAGIVMVIASMVVAPDAPAVAAPPAQPAHAPTGGSPQDKARMLGAGVTHNCAVTTRGAVLCWGDNRSGGLGDGTTTDALKPVLVRGLDARVKQVSSGYLFTCALTVRGAVKCWGSNLVGELGNGAEEESHVPVDVVGLGSGVTAIAAGESHACAVTSQGGVKCWGFGGYGALGDGSTGGYARTPVAVVGLAKGVTAISAALRNTCAIDRAHRVLCWGSNEFGQLGNNSTTDSPVPVPVGGLVGGVRQISVGATFMCAVTYDRAAKCWGENGDGELGNNSHASSSTPVGVLGLGSGVRWVSAGVQHACAVTLRRTVKCWGWNPFGALGDNSTDSSASPVDVRNLAGVRKVAVGWLHSCAVTTRKAVFCWGYGGGGELGNGATAPALTPVRVFGF